ncbi:substrate-binding domain-containing protein [Rhodococcus sp. G-MC3]|uniref:substrate-binding domain-containing protein n=1 Tax=Rhodococcus sp. G-MC3 TaxID=3046209 RepID=UPI0024B96275|nr:substrate-binding domain-containing protein [Rhodococcus sp. G-MC3]MDJ0394121.1 substrate-binding domain-containing protein [Rhodococcus sp. G-MC3]
MGEHRTAGGIRGISKGPFIVVGTIVVVVLAAFGWFQLRDRISEQGVQAAEACVEGAVTVPVTVDPDIASQISELALRYSKTGPVVRDHCVTVEVATQNSAAITGALATGAANWDKSTLGPLPALWIPQSSDAVSGLPAGTVDGTPRSVAGSPIVLAAPSAVTAALSGAGIGWADLPRLQQTPDGLDELGLTGWGGLRLRLPLGTSSDSTPAALAAVATAVSGTPGRELTPEQVRSAPIVAAMSALSTSDLGTAASSTDSTDAELAGLSSDLGSSGAVHAVPVTEQQMTSSEQTGITAYSPTGSAPTADHPAVILAGPWMDETLSRAAAQFVEFVRQPENSQLFADAGFDVGEASTDQLSASYETRQALIAAVQDPATARRATTLVDVSRSMDTTEGSRTRLGNTVAALTQQFESVIDSTDIGLWIYSKDLDGTRAFRELVPTGPVEEQLPGGTRRQQVITAASGLRPESATSTYESVMAAFVDAQDNFAPGKPNSVVLVTDGPNDDTSVSKERLLTALSSINDPARPVAIDVVSIGTNSDATTLQSMSEITGGSFATVPSSDGPELPDLLRKLLY